MRSTNLKISKNSSWQFLECKNKGRGSRLNFLLSISDFWSSSSSLVVLEWNKIDFGLIVDIKWSKWDWKHFIYN